MTITDIIDAIMNTAADGLTTDAPTYHTPDFRTWTPTVEHGTDGTPTLVTQCEELIEGRWESFISIKPIPERLWVQVT